MRPAQIAPGPQVILCADDYAISDTVSAGIEELASAGRLSATSCMVTFPEWPRLAQHVAKLSGQIAIGLHVNLTAGTPLGPMPHLAPGGTFPAVGTLIVSAARRTIDVEEIELEVRRQLDAFGQATGFQADFLDGHQHVHAVPGVRAGVLAAAHELTQSGALLLRDPTDGVSRIVRRKTFITKALSVSAIGFGLAKAARLAGFVTNEGFSGFSDFNPSSPYSCELEASLTACGPKHLTMCHPGHADDVLAKRDSVTARREQEFTALMAAEGLTDRLWHPDRRKVNIWGAAND